MAIRRILLSLSISAVLAGGLRTGSAAAGLPETAPATRPDGRETSATASEVQALIADLSSTSWQKRQRAQDALAALGEQARPRLMQVLRESADEETRTRAEAALRQIEQSGSISVSFITLHLKASSPRQVFAEISRQAGALLLPNPGDLWEARTWPAASFDADRAPFWTVMREICDRYGLVPQYRGSGLDREMFIGDPAALQRPWGNGPSALSGPFMIVPTIIYTHRSVDLTQPVNASRNCHIQLMVYPEPKIRVLRASQRAVVQEAVDDRGNRMGVDNAVPDAMPMGMWSRNLIISLTMPDGRSERIARLKASARFVVQTRSEEARVDDVLSARNVARTVAGRRFVLKEVRRSGNNYVLRMGLYQKDWNAEEWMRLFPGQLFRLCDAKGNPYQRLNNGPLGVGPDQTELVLTYQRPPWPGVEKSVGEPATLTWEVPTESKEMQVPFELRDLPLP